MCSAQHYRYLNVDTVDGDDLLQGCIAGPDHAHHSVETGDVSSAAPLLKAPTSWHAGCADTAASVDAVLTSGAASLPPPRLVAARGASCTTGRLEAAAASPIWETGRLLLMDCIRLCACPTHAVGIGAARGMPRLLSDVSGSPLKRYPVHGRSRHVAGARRSVCPPRSLDDTTVCGSTIATSRLSGARWQTMVSSTRCHTVYPTRAAFVLAADLAFLGAYVWRRFNLSVLGARLATVALTRPQWMEPRNSRRPLCSRRCVPGATARGDCVAMASPFGVAATPARPPFFSPRLPSPPAPVSGQDVQRPPGGTSHPSLGCRRRRPAGVGVGISAPHVGRDRRRDQRRL